jgi:superfamily II DNA/RNA helicase
LAFGLPIITHLLDSYSGQNLEFKKNSTKDAADGTPPEDQAAPQALILTPTRELAIQIKDHLQICCKYSQIKIAVVVGGISQLKQERLLSKLPEIVVATPGRLMQLIDEV